MISTKLIFTMRCRGNDNGIICKGKKDDSNDADKTGMVE